MTDLLDVPVPGSGYNFIVSCKIASALRYLNQEHLRVIFASRWHCIIVSWKIATTPPRESTFLFWNVTFHYRLTTDNYSYLGTYYKFTMGTHIPLRTPGTGTPRPNPTSIPTVRFFGMRNDSEDDDDEHFAFEPTTTRPSAHRKQSFISRWRSSTGTESIIKSTSTERPQIPNALRRSQSDSTPLPALSMIVLSIVSFFRHSPS